LYYEKVCISALVCTVLYIIFSCPPVY